MKSFYIIGSGGFAKEVLFLAQQALSDSNRFRGFVDLQSGSLDCGLRNYPVLSEDWFLEHVLPDEYTSLYLGVGSPEVLAKCSEKYRDYSLPNLIHPGVIGDFDGIKMGIGNIITAGCILTVDISVGSFNIFNLNCTVGHDSKIGNFNVLNPGVNISGGVTLGDQNMIGTNATILQYLQVGSANILGASALLTKNTSDSNTLVGIPARESPKTN